MLFYLDIAIKKDDVNKFGIKEKLIEWGGESFSQEPPQYSYKETLIFDEYSDANYLKRYFYKQINNDFELENYRVFRLLGKQLSEIEELINLKDPDVDSHELYKFLADLYELDYFAIFLIRDEEEIDERYRIKSKEELARIFCNCLKWDSPEGALITKFDHGDNRGL
jgi:hypothetical protein